MKIYPLFLLAMTALIPATDSYAAPNTEVRLTDFGAKPNDGQDDFKAVQAAIAACRASKATRLVLPQGQYDFFEESLPANKHVFDFKGVDNLTIDGSGSTLMFRGKAQPFTFEKCANITVKNLKIDWLRPAFSQGKVLEAHDLTFDVEVDKEYPIDEKTPIAALMDYDPQTRLPIGNLDVFSGAITSQLIRPQVLRITLKESPNPEVAANIRQGVATLAGKLVVLRHEVYGYYGFDFIESSNCRLEDVSIYSVPGMGLHAALSRDISLQRVEVRIKPGSGRLMSTTADCQYYTFCLGTISIQNSCFEGMGDDGLNITAKYRQVQKIVSPTTIQAIFPVRGWQGPTPIPGEKIEFSNPRELVPHAVGTVKTAEWGAATKVFTIEFEVPLPKEVTENDYLMPQSYLAKGRISGSTFRGMRARGLVLSTRDVVIENCKFEAPVHTGIFLKGGQGHGAEDPANQQVVIRNNTFTGCGGAAIYAYAAVGNPGMGAQRDLVIEGNTIQDDARLTSLRIKGKHPEWVYWSAAIVLTSTENAIVRSNKIGSGFHPALFVDLSRNIEITGNQSAADSTIVVNQAKTSAITVKDNPRLTLDTNAKPFYSCLKYVNDLR